LKVIRVATATSLWRLENRDTAATAAARTRARASVFANAGVGILNEEKCPAELFGLRPTTGATGTVVLAHVELRNTSREPLTHAVVDALIFDDKPGLRKQSFAISDHLIPAGGVQAFDISVNHFQMTTHWKIVVAVQEVSTATRRCVASDLVDRSRALVTGDQK
jgi:hypothetical protein